MNPFDLSASDLLIWGMVLHFIADWPLQNDWMANNKAHQRPRWRRRWNDHSDNQPRSRWWDRHPAAYAHSGIHGLLLALVFGWVAIPLAVAHLVIDTRTPVVWWSKLIRQTQPYGHIVRAFLTNKNDMGIAPLYDVGTEVRFWTDQVIHIACIAVTAILVTL